MDGSIEWEKFHPVEDENDFPNSQDRRCPRCGTPVSGRPNKIYCTANCRKRHREGKRNAALSMVKRRENAELYDRAKRLTEMLYLTPPLERLGFMKDLIDIARAGKDAQLRDILSNQILIKLSWSDKQKYLHRNCSDYCTISQAASNYCKRFWKTNVRDVVYGRAPEPPTGVVK